MCLHNNAMSQNYANLGAILSLLMFANKCD